MTMTVEEARYVFEREQGNITRFLSYFDDVGVMLNIFNGLFAGIGSLKRTRTRCLNRLFKEALADIQNSTDGQWWQGAPSLKLVVAVTIVYGNASSDRVSVIPPEVVPSEETVIACLTLFHQSKGYVAEDDDPQDAPVGSFLGEGEEEEDQ